ncbi:MAG TPA: GntR family transcriptional regulator [Mobilitalea sp.]|nr:GntR family transcriptional regulator [Mobilitalea sp.]
MHINISGMSTLAIYEQIMNQIKDSIIKRELLPGEGMPSIRNLAKDLQISVITTKRAYEELEKEGLLKSVAGKGFYVCEQNTDFLKEKQTAMLENRYAAVVRDSKKAGIALADILDTITILYDSVE